MLSHRGKCNDGPIGDLSPKAAEQVSNAAQHEIGAGDDLSAPFD